MKKKQYLNVLLILLLLTGLGAGGYGYYQLFQERNELRSQVASDAARIDLLQDKYKEKKAVEANLMRKTMMLQGQLSKVTLERDALEKNLEELINEKTADCERAKTELGQQVESIKKQQEQLKSELDQLRAQHTETLAELESKRTEFVKLTNLHERTESQLARTVRTLDRCADHNTQLSIITQELVRNYSETGVVGSLAIAEPFTQLKQVEMEQMVQEYLERIEKEKFEKRN